MAILDQLYAVMSMLRIFIMFLAAFFFIPSLVVKRDKEFIDRKDHFFPVFFMGTFFIMMVIHIASVTNMMDSFAMIMLTLLALGAFRYVGRKKHQEFELSVADELIIYILDLSDSGMDFFAKMIFFINTFFTWIKTTIGRGFSRFKQEPILYLLNFITFSYALSVRAIHSINHYYLASSDAYLHLVWTKYLSLNGLYQDGVYPEGMHAAFAYIGTLFNIDTYYIFRYMGPLIGLLMIYSIYHFVKQHLNINPYAPWFAVSVYVFVTTYPTQVWRQISALPQEYAMIFMLPTLHFLICYVERGNKRDLLLYAIGLAIGFLIHFYSGFYVIVASLIYGLFRLMKIIKDKKIIPLLVYGLGGIFAGFLPMIAAVLAGYPLHPSFDFVKQSITGVGGDLTGTEVQKTVVVLTAKALWQNDWTLILAVTASLLLVLWYLLRQNKDFGKVLMVGTMTVFLYIEYESTFFNLPSLMLKDRIGVFLAIFASISAGGALGLFVQWFQHRIKTKWTERGLSLAFFVLLITSFPPLVPVGAQYEYDQSAKGYVTIVQEFPKNTMTIIGVQEQYQQIYGKGYHYQLWQFISDQSDDTVKEIKIPTNNVFVFTEKQPFRSEEKVNRQSAIQSIPKLSGDLTIYYIQYRHVLESKIYFWAEAFMKRYPENTEVFYEDEFIKIYWIKQDMLNPINLKTVEPSEVFVR